MTPRLYKLTAALLVALGAAFVYQQAQRRNRQQSDLDLTAQRVTAFAEPVCRILAPPTRTLQVAPRFETPPLGPQWEAACGTLENGEPVVTASLRINPQTGEPQSITVQPPGRPFVRSSKDLTGLSESEVAQEMRALAKRWLVQLGLAEGKEWRFVSAGRMDSIHSSHWVTNQKKAVILIDMKQGELRQITLNPGKKRPNPTK